MAMNTYTTAIDVRVGDEWIPNEPAMPTVTGESILDGAEFAENVGRFSAARNNDPRTPIRVRVWSGEAADRDAAGIPTATPAVIWYSSAADDDGRAEAGR